MANQAAIQVRLREAVREALVKFLAEEALPEPAAGEALFTVIEDLAPAAGDAVGLELFDQRLERLPAEAAVCPHCSAEGQRVKQRDRTLTTRRGLVRQRGVGGCWAEASRLGNVDSGQGNREHGGLCGTALAQVIRRLAIGVSTRPACDGVPRMLVSSTTSHEDYDFRFLPCDPLLPFDFGAS